MIPFLFLTLLGTFLAITSSSWFLAWIGLETNLLGIMPLIFYNSKNQINESPIKYFIIQTLASSIIILSIVNMPHMNESFLSIFPTSISLALSIKMALAPFHLWIIQLIESFDWTLTLLILTWQKIAPIILLSPICPKDLLFILIVSSALLGSIGGFSMSSPKKIMAFSSIAHSGWMVTSLIISWSLWLIYFTTYSFICLTLFMTFAYKNISNINQINLNPSNNLFKLNLTFNLLSMAGLPPLLGFFPKLMLVTKLLNNYSNFILLLTLAASSLISLYFYMKIIVSMTMHPLTNLPFKTPFSPHQILLISNMLINLIGPPLFMISV